MGQQISDKLANINQVAHVKNAQGAVGLVGTILGLLIEYLGLNRRIIFIISINKK